MPKIDLTAAPARQGSGYPSPFDAPCAGRIRQRLGNAGGMSANANVRFVRKDGSPYS